MSILAVLASKATSDMQLLGEIDDALLQLQLETAGKAETLEYRPEDLQVSRKILAEFLKILTRAITRAQQGQLAATKTHKERAAENMLPRLNEQGESREDWLDDIKKTIRHQQSGNPIETADWELFEFMVDFLVPVSPT